MTMAASAADVLTTAPSSADRFRDVNHLTGTRFRHASAHHDPTPGLVPRHLSSSILPVAGACELSQYPALPHAEMRHERHHPASQEHVAAGPAAAPLVDPGIYATTCSILSMNGRGASKTWGNRPKTAAFLGRIDPDSSKTSQNIDFLAKSPSPKTKKPMDVPTLRVPTLRTPKEDRTQPVSVSIRRRCHE